MIADCQYRCYQLWLRDSHTVEELSMSEIDNRPLRDCVLFGPSTKNIKIEGWWGQLVKKQLSP